MHASPVKILRQDGTFAEYASSTGYDAQEDRAQRILSSIHKIKIDRMIWRTGQTVVPQPHIERSISARRRANTSDAGITTVHSGTRGKMEKHEVTTLNEKALLQGFSRDLEVSGKLDAVFSCQSESTQNTRERIAVLPDYGRLQSSSTTHYQLLAWRRWNA